MKLSSIHVKSLAINASNISTTTINGQEHYVIRGAVPIVDDIVMNGGLYPAEEINNSYQTMERKLMPIGHPMVNGKYVSANDPQAVNDYYAGAWAQNVSKANDKVVMDVYVNKAVADTKPDGKRLIQRLDDMISGNNADPIHVSTGLLLNKEQKAGESKQKKYSWVAHNMQFDHIAILLDEPGAGTPDEGVGMFVNADGQEADVEATSLIDAANSMKDGLLNKVKFFFAHNSDASFDEIYQMLREASGLYIKTSGGAVWRRCVKNKQVSTEEYGCWDGNTGSDNSARLLKACASGLDVKMMGENYNVVSIPSSRFNLTGRMKASTADFSTAYGRTLLTLTGSNVTYDIDIDMQNFGAGGFINQGTDTVGRIKVSNIYGANRATYGLQNAVTDEGTRNTISAIIRNIQKGDTGVDPQPAAFTVASTSQRGNYPDVNIYDSQGGIIIGNMILPT